jgi:hypothetical protein
MGVKLVSSGGGSVEINPPTTASNFVATMPAATGNVVVDSATQTLTNKAWSSPAGSTITSATAVTASGTSVDFTGIPAWVKRVTVMFSGVSSNGSSNFLIQSGAGSVQTTGYSSASTLASTGASTGAVTTNGFLLFQASVGAGFTFSGIFTLTNVSSNTWVGSGVVARTDGSGNIMMGGTLALSGALDRIRITTVNGTDTFDAGTINILYE